MSGGCAENFRPPGWYSQRPIIIDTEADEGKKGRPASCGCVS